MSRYYVCLFVFSSSRCPPQVLFSSVSCLDDCCFFWTHATNNIKWHCSPVYSLLTVQWLIHISYLIIQVCEIPIHSWKPAGLGIKTSLCSAVNGIKTSHYSHSALIWKEQSFPTQKENTPSSRASRIWSFQFQIQLNTCPLLPWTSGFRSWMGFNPPSFFKKWSTESQVLLLISTSHYTTK